MMRDTATTAGMIGSAADRDAVDRLPKIELHVHLEATPRRSTLKRLAREAGLKLPPELDPDSGRPPGFDDLDHFLKALSAINPLFSSPDVYGLMTYEFLETLAAQQVVYAEIRFSPSRPVLDRHFDMGALIGAVNQGRLRAERDFGIKSGLLLCLSRVRGAEVCSEVARMAIAEADGALAGFDIADDETRWPARLFQPTFEIIAGAGYPSTVHAGETVGPQSVWEALDLAGVRRIGHGLSAHKDPKLVERLREARVHIELCPTSNVRTNQIPSLEEHPLRSYVNSGLSVSVNSDDPIAFGSDITTEYALLVSVYGLNLVEVENLTLNALEASFAPEAVKAAIRRDIVAGYEAARIARPK